jgi:hypothetical protein
VAIPNSSLICLLLSPLGLRDSVEDDQRTLERIRRACFHPLGDTALCQIERNTSHAPEVQRGSID